MHDNWESWWRKAELDLGALFGGRHGPHRSGPFRGGRMFEQGDLKYVILQLLEEKPRHGYEIIKALEERFRGAYAPSAGTVYPTLSLLEDLGYAVVAPEEGGKKVYSITDEGRKYLAENRGAVDDIFERIATFVSGFRGEPIRDLSIAFKDLARATFSTATRQNRDAATVARIREVLERARREIEDISRTAQL